MKYLILISLGVLSFSCCTTKEIPLKDIFVNQEMPHIIKPIEIRDQTDFMPVIVIRDTIYVEKKYDSLQVVIKKKNDSLFIERYKLERVKYYNGIVKKNSSQLKFLSGWINRAIK